MTTSRLVPAPLFEPSLDKEPDVFYYVLNLTIWERHTLSCDSIRCGMRLSF